MTKRRRDRHYIELRAEQLATLAALFLPGGETGDEFVKAIENALTTVCDECVAALEKLGRAEASDFPPAAIAEFDAIGYAATAVAIRLLRQTARRDQIKALIAAEQVN